MIGFKTILCPTDFSAPAREALFHAISVARWFGSDIALLHVAPPVLSSEALWEASPAPVVSARAREELHARLVRFAEPAEKAGLRLRLLVEEGRVADRILEAAEETGADLIVLGTHGMSGFERYVLGSVTEKVLRKSICPVMTVPPAASPAVPGAVLFRSILCPVDFSPPSLGALELALSIASEARAKLVVAHVVEALPPEDARAQRPFGVAEWVSVMEADAKARLEALIPAGARAAVSPEILVTSGKPHREIARIAEKRGTGIIVMGARGLGPLESVPFGSTTSHVVRSVMCPVLTFRSEARRSPSREKERAAAV